MLKIQSVLVPSALLILCLFHVESAYAEIVVFPDAGLDAAVRQAIGKPTGDIFDTDLVGIGFVNLVAEGRGITDLRGLEYCTDLTSLNLGDNHISHISALAGLTNLQYLWLQRNQINDINALTGLTGLVALDLSVNQVSDISVLAGLIMLQDLNLNANQVDDLSALGGLPHLTFLIVAGNRISDITVLGGLTSLWSLRVDANQISDIRPVAGLTNLREFGACSNRISDISAVAGLITLETLILDDNEIHDIGALSGLTNLSTLLLDINQIVDISSLAPLTDLRCLYLWGNEISDISVLAGLPALSALILKDNLIADLSPLTGLADLSYLDLATNQITDIMPLVTCGGLGPDDPVLLNGNPLSQQALCGEIPELQARWVTVVYEGQCGATSGCTMFDLIRAEGEAVAAALGGSLGLSPDYEDWDIEGWPATPYGDGMPDLWQLRLIADAYCNHQHRLHELVMSVYEANFATLLADKPEVAFSWTAAAIGLSSDMRATICAIYGLDPSHFQVVREPGKGIDEPFSASGDCDGDGNTNIEEYQYVIASGGDIDAFAVAASENSPFWIGNPEVPVAGVWGLVLLAGSLGLVGAVVRKKL